ncbi:MAG TPA: EamA family transporter [Chitinophagaceae bacterium]|nr:EamA family transporter [Chitinophagaceae bacterium]
MKNHTKAYLAYAFICIIWGTTYLGIKVAVEHYPPFLMAGCRQLLSGIVLIAVALIANPKADLSRRNLLQQALIGFLLITLGNGLVTWAEQYIQSGVAALICSTMPISAVIINIVRGKEKLNWMILLGMLLGFGGVALIFRDNLSQQSGVAGYYILGIGALFVATISWAWGSLLNKSSKTSINSSFNVGFQLLAGGAIMLLISPVVDDYTGLVLWNSEGLMAFFYLVVFGSILAYAAYMYALKVLPVGFVTSYAYINPLVAVILGALMLNEPLNVYTVFAFVLIILGIFIVRSGYKKQEAAQLKSTD